MHRRKLILNIHRFLMVVLTLSLFTGCTPALQSRPGGMNTLPVTDITGTLPRDNQWRQTIALHDMDGDGLTDIIAPPPRRAKAGETIPYIFVRDRQEGTWKEGAFSFPSLKDYGYGGIAVADINSDSHPDIVIAVHEGRIILLENNGNNGFVEKPFPVKDRFHSRVLEVSDLNGDGRKDIIALSESSFSPKQGYTPKGILIGMNNGDGTWEVKTVEGSSGLFGDSLAVEDINGDGNKDIIIAQLIRNRNRDRLVWFGDGFGNFTFFDADMIGEEVLAHNVRAADIDGDGKNEIVFRVIGFGADAKGSIRAYKWNGSAFDDISRGLETVTDPIAFDLADMRGNGGKELILLTGTGLSMYTHTGTGWIESGQYQLPYAETLGAFDLRAEKNRDGSLLVVYNLGLTENALNMGIRSYLLK
jgi:hypothetical protein